MNLAASACCCGDGILAEQSWGLQRMAGAGGLSGFGDETNKTQASIKR